MPSLSEEKKQEISKLKDKDMSHGEVAEKLGVSKWSVSEYQDYDYEGSVEPDEEHSHSGNDVMEVGLEKASGREEQEKSSSSKDYPMPEGKGKWVRFTSKNPNVVEIVIEQTDTEESEAKEIIERKNKQYSDGTVYVNGEAELEYGENLR